MCARVLFSVVSTSKTSFEQKISWKKGSNAFSKVSYTTLNQNGEKVLITSDYVRELENKHYALENMNASFSLANGDDGRISANKTTAINGDDTVCDFSGNVILATKSGLHIKTESVRLDFNKKFATGSDNVFIKYNETELCGKGFTFDMQLRELILSSNAIAKKNESEIKSNKIIVHLSNDQGDNNIKMAKAIGYPHYKSKEYDLKASESIMYSGNVMIANKHVRLLYLSYDINCDHMRALLDTEGKIKEITARDNLTIKTENARITASYGVFDGDHIKVYEKVTISNQDGDIFGDAAILNVQTGEIKIKNTNGIMDDGKIKNYK